MSVAIQRASARHQAGFTLIELLVVVAIIGILAAVAIPKFVDASNDAKMGVLKGTGGAVASASATNYALRAAGNTGSTTTAVTSCSASFSTIAQIPSGVTIGAATTNTPVLGTAPANTGGALGYCNATDGTNNWEFQVVYSN